MQNLVGHPLVVMVGLPRSGKSTRVASHWRGKRGYIVVCPDDLRLTLHGQRYLESAEPTIWATTFLMTDYLLKVGYKVVVDDTHVTRAKRALWVARGAYFDLVLTPADECLRRASNDPHIQPVIRQMAAEWEGLDNEEKNSHQRGEWGGG